MHTLRRKILLKTYVFFDLITMMAWFVIAVAIEASSESNFTFSAFVGMRVKLNNFAIFFGFVMAWYLIFLTFGIYDTRRLSNRKQEILDLLKATTVGVVLLAASATVFRIRLVTPIFLIVFGTGTMGTGVISRLILRATLTRLRRRGRNLRHLLIVGINHRALEFAREVSSKKELGYMVAGFIDVEDRAGLREFKKAGFIYVSDFDKLHIYLRDHVVDEVAIFLPMKTLYGKASTIIDICEEHGIIVRLPADPFDLRISKSRQDNFEGTQLLTLYTGTMEGPPLLIKRFFDILVSLVAVVALFPLFVVIALFMKASSTGPVFFLQERVGINKRRFHIYKFRTMVPDAEKKMAELEHLNEVRGPAFKIKNDPRITPIGKFLRKTSFDELPQLFNVLKGDMSLVGPRPLPLRDYEGFNEDWQRRRFSVRPGITCLWQVGGRSNVSFDRWMQLDMQYIDNWSLWLDLKILLMTLPAVVRGSGAA
jgi:exopolysaccharide biosynthesis polyprenyl glycosylphosphotransferase